jgi:hypothetical protein
LKVIGLEKEWLLRNHSQCFKDPWMKKATRACLLRMRSPSLGGRWRAAKTRWSAQKGHRYRLLDPIQRLSMWIPQVLPIIIREGYRQTR